MYENDFIYGNDYPNFSNDIYTKPYTTNNFSPFLKKYEKNNSFGILGRNYGDRMRMGGMFSPAPSPVPSPYSYFASNSLQSRPHPFQNMPLMPNPNNVYKPHTDVLQSGISDIQTNQIIGRITDAEHSYFSNPNLMPYDFSDENIPKYEHSTDCVCSDCKKKQDVSLSNAMKLQKTILQDNKQILSEHNQMKELLFQIKKKNDMLIGLIFLIFVFVVIQRILNKSAVSYSRFGGTNFAGDLNPAKINADEDV
jgi:hypothetical protein